MQMNSVLFLSCSSRCVKMRRVALKITKIGGDGGDDSIGGKKKFNN